MSDYNNGFLDAIKYIVKGFVDSSNYDKTVKGIVTSKSNKYMVQINGNEYSADSFASVEAQVNDVVYVLVPQNNWDGLVIVGKKGK